MLKTGDRVIVPGPETADAWTEANFLARIAGFRGDGNAIVVDQDDNAWQIESTRLTLAENEDEPETETEITQTKETAYEFSVGDRVLYKSVRWMIVEISFKGGRRLIALEPEEPKIWVHPEEIVPIEDSWGNHTASSRLNVHALALGESRRDESIQS